MFSSDLNILYRDNLTGLCAPNNDLYTYDEEEGRIAFMILTSVRTLRPCCSCSNLAGSTLRLLHTFQPRYVRCEKTSCPRSCFAGYTPISHCKLRPRCACYGLTADAPTSLYTLRPRFACSEKSLKSIDPPPSLAGIYTRQIQIQGTYILVMLAK